MAQWEHIARGFNPVEGDLKDEGALERGRKKGSPCINRRHSALRDREGVVASSTIS